MQNILSKSKCKSHNLEIIAILLEKQKSFGEMILCPKCLIEKKFNNGNKVIIINEIPEMVEEMQKKLNTHTQAQLSERYSYFSKLQVSMTNYKQWIEGLFNKILTQIQKQINEMQQQLNLYNNNQQNNQIKESDIFRLCKYLNNENEETMQILHRDQEIIKYVRESLSVFYSGEQYQELFKLLESKSKNDNQEAKAQTKQILSQKQQMDEIPSFNQSTQWRFSKEMKHSMIELNNDCKTASLSNEFAFSTCLCDQVIPSIGTVAIEFKVKKMQQLYVGICIKEKIANSYVVQVCNNENWNNNWCYFMSANGCTFFHKENSQQHNFKININDIIRIEVNKQTKTITWTNKSSNYSPIARDIPLDEDLYYCILMHGQNEVELI